MLLHNATIAYIYIYIYIYPSVNSHVIRFHYVYFHELTRLFSYLFRYQCNTQTFLTYITIKS